MTKKTWILIGFLLLKFLLQYAFINPYYDLHRDEYLYLDQGNHPAWGYLSVPPAISWTSIIIQSLGGSIFWVKFFPALFGALTILVVWKTIEELNGNLYALILGATCILLSALLRLNFLYQPNSLDVLCWTAFYYFLIKYFKNEKAGSLYIAAVVFAIGFLNKYNIAFLLIGLAPAVLLTDQRKIFLRKEFYISIFIGLLLILPNLIWQYKNHYPVVHHMRELSETQLINMNRWDFLKEQTFYFIGALPLIVASLYALLFYPPFKKYRTFFPAFIFTLTTFIYFKAKGYYAIGLYPVFISFGAVFLADVLNTGRSKYLKLVLISIPVLFYFLSFRLYAIQTPEEIMKKENVYRKYGLLRWEDGKDHPLPQDFADMLGWKELAQKTDSTYSIFPNTENTLILCDNYGQAAAINFYTKNKKVRAVSFNADYINWFDPAMKIDNLIRVKDAEGSEKEIETSAPFFNSYFVAGRITNPYAREYNTTIFVFRSPKIDLSPRLRAEIYKHKNYQ